MNERKKITVEDVRTWRSNQTRPLVALTAYDYTFARLVDAAGVDIIHVGDSLGMAVLGYEDTTQVTMEDMVRASSAVARAKPCALITADLPFASYDSTEQAVKNSQRLRDAGADAVKMEGGTEILPQVQAVMAAGIAVQGHLGMLPQHIREEGGYKKKGRTEQEAEKILKDARAFEEAGVFSIVLEGVVNELAAEVTQTLSIPTIGIASGKQTSGQIMVVTDVLGLTPWLDFPFIVKEADLADEVTAACKAYCRRVRNISG